MLANQLHISAEEATRQTINNLINKLIYRDIQEENMHEIELKWEGKEK